MCVKMTPRARALLDAPPTNTFTRSYSSNARTHPQTRARALKMRQTLITTITGSRTIRCVALAAVASAAILPIRHFTTITTGAVAATGTITTLTTRRRVALPAPERPVVVELEQVEVVEEEEEEEVEEAPDHRIIIITRITTIIITIRRRQRRRLQLPRRPLLPPGAAWSVPSCARLSENHRCLVLIFFFSYRVYFSIANATS